MSILSDKWSDNPSGTFKQEVPTGTINNINCDFFITETPIAGSLSLFLNGILETEYTFFPATKKITFTTAPLVSQNFYVTYNY